MSSTPSTKFAPYAIASVLGIGVLVSPYIVGLPEGMQQAKEFSKIEAQEQLERSMIEQQALTTKLLREKEQVRNLKELIVSNYGYDIDVPPNMGKDVIQRYSMRTKVLVFDRDGYCIGTIEAKKFSFRGDNAKVCNNVDDVKVNKK